MSHDLSVMTDEVLMSSLHALVRASNSVDADLLVHLSELDTRQLYRERGFPSLFALCLVEFGFSENVAYNRIEVARLARRLPEVLEPLREGDIHLSGLRLLAPHLTSGNCAELLGRAKRKSKRQIEELIVELAPKPDVPDSIRRLPVSKAAAPIASLFEAPKSEPMPVLALPSERPTLEPVPVARPSVTPLSPETY